MRVYLKEVEIDGWPGKFQKICDLDKVRGHFKITTPDYVVKDGLTQTSYVISDTLKDAEAKYDSAVRVFKMKDADFKTVILYEIEESGSYMDGSGAGFVFKWGIFRKITLVEGYPEYYYERGFVNKEKYQSDGWGTDLKSWKQIDWSQEREDSFMLVSQRLEALFNLLMNCDFTQSLTKQLGFTATKEDSLQMTIKIPEGSEWVHIDNDLPYMKIDDLFSGGTPVFVKNAEGKIWETSVSDHNVWEAIVRSHGVTHWLRIPEGADVDELVEQVNSIFKK